MGPRNKVLVVFTAKTIRRLLKEGGTSRWRLDPRHARHCQFAVCTRNANAPPFDDGAGPEEHRSAFLVGKVKSVVDDEGRYLVRFSEYALVDVPDVWKGDRNPVKYAASLQALGIEESKLTWEQMPVNSCNLFDPEPEAVDPSESEGEEPSQRITSRGTADPVDVPVGLTLAEAKRGLALTFGVAPEAIEITIRG